jgi:hypothetical protein
MHDCVQGSGYAAAGDALAALRCWDQAALVSTQLKRQQRKQTSQHCRPLVL